MNVEEKKESIKEKMGTVHDLVDLWVYVNKQSEVVEVHERKPANPIEDMKKLDSDLLHIKVPKVYAERAINHKKNPFYTSRRELWKELKRVSTEINYEY